MVVQDVTLSCMSEAGRVILLHIEAEAEAESRESPDDQQKLLARHGSNKGLANEDTISPLRRTTELWLGSAQLDVESPCFPLQP